MAAKKFYAVKKGKKTGIFSTWAECKASVDGYSGAEYKGFASKEEAAAYLGDYGISDGIRDGSGREEIPRDAADLEASKKDRTTAKERNALLAYVDGSYDDSLKKYAFGCVFILSDGRIYTEYGNGDNPQSLQHRNVTGEMLGAMYATKFALLNGFQALEIRYDYQGIEKWVTGEWRSKTELTRKYALAMREWGRSIQLTFTKVAAHTNVRFNELADQTAKKGLREGNGVPKVKRIEEMTVYGTDTTE